VAARTARSWGARARRIFVVGVSIVACATVLAACDSGGGSAQPGATTTSKPPPSPVAPVLTKGRANLTITGTPNLNLTLTNIPVTCKFPSTALPPSYIITSYDFAPLGPGGGVTIFGDTVVPERGTVPPSIKLVAQGVGYITAPSGAGVTVDPEKKTVHIDADLDGAVGGSSADTTQDPVGTLPAHMTGTITCN
jgi:hypothetical protein